MGLGIYIGYNFYYTHRETFLELFLGINVERMRERLALLIVLGGAGELVKVSVAVLDAFLDGILERDDLLDHRRAVEGLLDLDGLAVVQVDPEQIQAVDRFYLGSRVAGYV